jgi:hypothetical protein
MVTIMPVPEAMLAAVRESNVPAPGKMARRVGKITPLNLLSGSTRFISDKAMEVCCGPYAECHICNY